jgi:biotin synthase
LIRVSAGTAAVLSLKQSKMEVAPTTAYLMCGTRCSRQCAFCAQGRDAKSRADLLSRVTWPAFDPAVTADGVARAYREGGIRRACIQVVLYPDFLKDTLLAVREIKQRCDVPLCVSVYGSFDIVGQIFDAGADGVTVPIDAVSEDVYAKTKGPGFESAVSTIEACAREFPGRIGTHIVIGLGETDEAAARMIQRMYDLGVRVGLFSFTPVKGTPLEDERPPPLERYRAVQAARFLMERGHSRAERMVFSGGRLFGFGLDEARVVPLLCTGEAFETCGCPDCNRPYYNERPGGAMYNYPRPLTEAEARQAISEAISWIRGEQAFV